MRGGGQVDCRSAARERGVGWVLHRDRQSVLLLAIEGYSAKIITARENTLLDTSK